MSARVEDGWLVADCDASDATPVMIAVGKPEDFAPAFRDFSSGDRVAKIRLPQVGGRVRVFLKVGSQVIEAGLVTLDKE